MARNTRPKRLRRCQLAVPGSSAKMLQKAAGMDVDYVFLDLEDSVAPDRKKAARGQVVQALNELDWGRTTRTVRINDVQSRFCYGDIIEVVSGAGANLDIIMVPKVMSAADVIFVDLLVTQLERDLGLELGRIGLECLIEEVEAIINVEEIAASTPRLEALILGVGDYSASQGIPISEIAGDGIYPPDIWHYQRQRMTIACKANGLDAVDGPYPDFGDPDGFRRECERAQILGAVGKWAIHPSQVAIAQNVFTPAQSDVARARAMKVAFDEAVRNGLGAVTYEGKMIDLAVIRLVQNIIDRADLAGV